MIVLTRFEPSPNDLRLPLLFCITACGARDLKIVAAGIGEVTRMNEVVIHYFGDGDSISFDLTPQAMQLLKGLTPSLARRHTKRVRPRECGGSSVREETCMPCDGACQQATFGRKTLDFCSTTPCRQSQYVYEFFFLSFKNVAGLDGVIKFYEGYLVTIPSLLERRGLRILIVSQSTCFIFPTQGGFITPFFPPREA